MAKTGQKQYAKTPPKAFYLGGVEDKKRRIANLEATARLLDVRGASTVVQIVADISPHRLAELIKSLP